MNTWFSRSKIELFPEILSAIVDETITFKQPGRVKFQGSYWPARIYKSNGKIILRQGTLVQVIGIENITLLVMPD